jgi:hypothetical protein
MRESKDFRKLFQTSKLKGNEINLVDTGQSEVFINYHALFQTLSSAGFW